MPKRKQCDINRMKNFLKQREADNNTDALIKPTPKQLLNGLHQNGYFKFKISN